MDAMYTEDKTFDKIDFTQNPLPKGEYENCTFINCDFSNANLSEIKFSETEFRGCNLSLVKLHQTALRDIKFKECKMLGLEFGNCSQFGLAVNFEDCNLTHSSFLEMKIRKTIFKNCQLHEVEFSESDLSGSYFDNCDLQNAIFENSILNKADLRTSFNYSINPEVNRLKKAKFSLSGLPGLLDQYELEVDRLA